MCDTTKIQCEGGSDDFVWPLDWSLERVAIIFTGGKDNVEEKRVNKNAEMM